MEVGAEGGQGAQATGDLTGEKGQPYPKEPSGRQPGSAPLTAASLTPGFPAPTAAGALAPFAL